MSRTTKVVAVVVAFVAVAAGGFFVAKATNSSTNTTTTSTTLVQTLACRGIGFSGVFDTSNGAAGTVYTGIILTNNTVAKCTVNGWPTMTFFDASGNTMPSSITESGDFFAGLGGVPTTPTSYTIEPHATVRFELAYSHVPVGTETTCPTVDHLHVFLPDSLSAGGVINVAAGSSFAPCASGAVTVSPYYQEGAPQT